jgi:hypothetical protein
MEEFLDKIRELERNNWKWTRNPGPPSMGPPPPPRQIQEIEELKEQVSELQALVKELQKKVRDLDWLKKVLEAGDK